jgi:hypothetical protein
VVLTNKRNAISDQRGEIGFGKTDAWRRFTIVFDIRVFVEVVRKGAG